MQIAVFVDAGYLYAQGSSLLAGRKASRNSITLLVCNVLESLAETARKIAPSARLLRIYWYDGLPRDGRLRKEQKEIARASDAKLRLGSINSRGQQKGVDSLIVTDIIELARNRAISDALLLAGDEDIRVGIQIAQTCGVRVHLLGLGMGSQSPDLVQEADTHFEWRSADVTQWMTVQPAAANVARTPGALRDGDFEAVAIEAVETAIDSLEQQSRLEEYAKYAAENGDRIPSETDRPTLARLRNRLDRDLDPSERSRYREIFAERLRERIRTN